MPASSIIVNGQTTRSPNVYSEVDASSMVTNGVGLTSLVLIGNAIGGKPASAFAQSEIPMLSATTPDEVSAIFKSGDLRDAGLLAFKASNDPKIPSSPQRVLFYKTNDSTQSSLVLKGTSPSGLADALTITSIQYGAFANQTQFELVNGTNGGIKAIVRYEGVDDEIFDDVGSESALAVKVESSAPFDSLSDVQARADHIAGSLGQAINPNTYKYLADATLAQRDNTESNDVFSMRAVFDTVAPYPVPVSLFGLDASDNPQAPVVKSFHSSTLNQIDDITSSDLKTLTAVSIDDEFQGSFKIQRVDMTDNVNPVYTDLLSITGRVSNYLPANGSRLTFESLNADSATVATIIGKNANGATISEDVLATQAGQLTTATFTVVDSITFASPSDYQITVSANATIHTIIASGTTQWGNGQTLGLVDLKSLPVSSSSNTSKLKIRFSDVPAQSGTLVLRGKVGSSDISEKIAFNNTTTVFQSGQAWTSLDQLDVLESIENDTPNTSVAPSLSLEVEAFKVDYDGLSLADLVVNIGAVSGLYAITVRDGSNAIPASVLDQTDTSVANNTTRQLYAVNYDLEQALSASGLVRAESNLRIRPSNRANTLLTGGSDYGFGANGLPNTSTPTANFLSAFSALQGVKNVVIVPLSTEDSVHRALATHCKYMEAQGRDERNGYIGLPTNLSKSDVKAKIRGINSRNVSAIAQSVKSFDEFGVLQSYSSTMLAVIAGAMQCGSPIGMPLTNKVINATEVNNSGDWSPSRNAEELLEMSLMFAKFDQERGVIWERSLTTWRNDSNSAFTEMSTNESVNVSTKLCRQSVENRIGDRAFAGLSGVLKALIAGELQRQISDGIIKSFAPQSIVVQDLGDAFNIQYEIAPLEPVNFIKITAHIKRQPVSA